MVNSLDNSSMNRLGHGGSLLKVQMQKKKKQIKITTMAGKIQGIKISIYNDYV